MSPARGLFVRKVIALGILGVAILVVCFLVVAPISGLMIDAHDEVVSLRERLGALRAQRGDLAALETELRAQAVKANDRPMTINVPSVGAGWQRVEAILRDIANARDVEVTSARALRLEDEAGFKALRLEASLRVPRDQLTGFINAIETNAPVLFIEKIKLAAQRPSDPRSADDRIQMETTIRALGVVSEPQKTARR